MYAPEIFVKAMQLNKLVKITFLSIDAIAKSSICIPLDFSIGKNLGNKTAQYFCWDNESSPPLLQIPICDMHSVEMLEDGFDPSVLKYLVIDEDEVMQEADITSTLQNLSDFVLGKMLQQPAQ